MKQPSKFVLSVIFCIATLNNFAGGKNPLNAPIKSPAAGIKMLSTFLYTATGHISDGNRVVFDPQYSNAVDGNDAIKIVNPGENFGLLRDTKILAVEARQPIANGDTLFYNMTNLVPQVYKLEIAPQNLEGTTVNCELIDRYLNTRTTINLTDSNHFTFEITADPASKTVNRLIVVFSTTVIPTAFTFSNISAINNDNKIITVNWQVNEELTVDHYEVERSADNINFSSLSNTLPLYNDQVGGSYQYHDMQPMVAENYYRIRSVSKNGVSVYSDKVKVTISGSATSMNIYPNPVINHSFQVQLQQVPPGRYFIKLTTNSGQQVYITPVNIRGNNFTQAINLSTNVSKGDYNVTLWSEDGIVRTQRVIIQ